MFVNLPVADLQRSIDFFTSLGFAFNPQFTGEKAACVIVNENAFAMLLTEPFFKSFTTRQICDTKTHCEALFAFSCESRADVDQIVHKAVAAGGKHAADPADHGFMYDWSFFDPDGHEWGVFWMDPSHVQPTGAH